MILPGAVDLQITARQPFPDETGFFQHPPAGLVMHQTGRLHPVQAQRAEGEAQAQPHRIRHITLTGEGHAHPIAEAAALRDAAPDIAQRDAAQQLVVILAEQEEGVALVALPLLGIALQAAAIGGAAERIARPGRLPRRQEIAAERAQFRPLPPVSPTRRAQIKPLAPQGGFRR